MHVNSSMNHATFFFSTQTSSILEGHVFSHVTSYISHRLQYQLVREALAERFNFLKNAPHLAHELPIMIPIKEM